VRHRASPRFWNIFGKLPQSVRQLAEKNYKLLATDPRHPSLHFKKIVELWSVRIGSHYRAIGIDDGPNGVYWIWIGTHADYDKIVG